jgi:hypothetical protein
MPRPAALQAARDRVVAEGGRVGGVAPYGWRYAGFGGRFVPLRNEQAVRFLVFHLRERGLSLQGIADELERLDLPMRSGAKWSRQALHRVLTTPEQLEATG